ncbi:MAG: alpha-amylase family glycosyl hydrolase [Arachnia sp.]
MDLSAIRPLAQTRWSRATWPLGAHRLPDGTTFAVYAPAATRVQLGFYVFGLNTHAEVTVLPAKAGDGIWRAKLAGVPAGAIYGYRVWGPNWPYDPAWKPGSAAGFVADLDDKGNRFNPNKVLFDPYTREVTHTVYTDELEKLGVDGGVFGTGADDYQGVPRRQVDTGPYSPKGVVIDDSTPLAAKPNLEPEKTSVYEVQMQQLSGHPSAMRLHQLLAGETGFEDVFDIPREYLGTYKGAGMMAPYLKALGFSTVEFLPIHETNKSETARGGHTNAWGYLTLCFFAPTRQYSFDKELGGPTREFKEMVNAFHDAGLEVYLDVVYNHTGEGGNWNGDVATTGFVSLGGFGTAEYYQMTSNHIIVDGATGTSNQLNYSSRVARQLVMDSLRYWSRDMGVDGFRFDLATVLGRLPDQAAPDDWANQKRFFTNHPLLVEIADFAKAEHLEVIAEAWDLWGYEVGNFPRGWGEWNGRYRDSVRRFAKGDGNTQSFLEVFNGDYHHFHDSGGPQKTINFVDAHDGFNLADLVSYQHKNNDQPYPFGPSDGGTDDNISWDSGGSQPLRRQRLRNFWTLLFFSRGVPMVVAGDEFGRTQNGNNNPWALETIAMMNNYAMIPTNAPQEVPVGPDSEALYHDNLGSFETEPGVNGIFRFSRFVTRLRHRHEALQQQRWGDLIAGDSDVSYLYHNPWLTGGPTEGDRAVSVHIDSPGDHFWLMINMAPDPIDFTVRDAREGQVWRRIIDTATWAEPACNFWPEGQGMIVSGGATVEPYSIVVWHEAPHVERDVPVWQG